MGRSMPLIPSKWIRHQVDKSNRPKSSWTTSRLSSVRSAHDTHFHVDEPAQGLHWRRPSKPIQDPTLWHQSRPFFVAIVLILVVCLSWTIWLVLLTVAPNQAINYVMGTTELDNGAFWLLVEPSPFLSGLSMFGLSVVAVGYVYVGALLFGWGRQHTSVVPQRGTSMVQLIQSLQTSKDLRSQFVHRHIGFVSSSPVQEKSVPENATFLSTLRNRVGNFSWELRRKNSDTRKIMRVWIKVADVAIQQYMLYQVLEAGFPLPLVVACTSMVICNALVIVVLIYYPSPPSHIGEAFIDSLLDLLIAIGFPVLVLVYCLSTFDFDRASQKLIDDIFPGWSFENSARIHANPEQTARVFKSLQGLRFQSAGVCVARICNNILLLIGLRRLVRLLRAHVRSATTSNMSKQTRSGIYPRKHPLALVLLAMAVATAGYAVGSVHQSQQACSSFPTCTMHAHRWWLSSSSGDSVPIFHSSSNDFLCPCRVLIDVDFAPKTYALWRDPPDATAAVSNLAASGDLEIIQIVNRKLPVLPDMLRRCLSLKHMALIFTHTTTLPPWAAEFTELEFLHIEGKSTMLSLTSLPKGLFDNMHKFTFLHLGAHPMLPGLPDAAGIPNLRWITMAGLEAIRELPPSFALMDRLEIVLALMLSKLEIFPDISRSRQRLKLLVVDPSYLCCNGFLGTVCDLGSSSCGGFGPQDHESLTCLSPEQTAAPATLELFRAFNSTICAAPKGPPPPDQIGGGNGNIGPPPMQDNSTVSGVPPSEADQEAALERSMAQCQGILYRECKLDEETAKPGDGDQGICYSERFLPISCSGNRDVLKLRRQQIKYHIGRPCNVEFEAWLGCSP